MAKDSVSDMTAQTQRSFRPKSDNGSPHYELDDNEENDAPIWEMDMSSHPWSSTSDDNEKSFADEEGNVYSAVKAHHLSIADCERIFTVPEVFDDIMSGNYNTGLLRRILRCEILRSCWGRVHSSSDHNKRHAFRDSVTGQTIQLNEEVLYAERGTQDQKMKRMSLAVQLYMDMPPGTRQSFHPSLYKVRLCDDNNDDEGSELLHHPQQQAAIVGDHHQIYGRHYDAITTEGYHRAIHAHRKVHFSELKRVLKIRKFTQEEAVDVWYQREDFAHFKAEMTLLIRDAETSKELAAMWLDSEESERRRSLESSENLNDEAGKKDVSSSHKARPWWHDYDHSRRGLERYASPGQARQILASYKVALQKVFAEQRRQLLFQCFLPCLPVDHIQNADRIAEIYHEYTAWSSDLALAAGASDADAVRTNFDDDTRKTREYYILKQVIRNGYRVHKHMPEFMMPKCITPKGFLDEKETLLGTHYCDLDRTQRRRESIIERANKAVGRTPHTQTGEEAREEMSHLTSLDGPIAPALAPMFSVDNVDESSVASMSPQHGMKGRQSLASKAKNYPFQQ